MSKICNRRMFIKQQLFLGSIILGSAAVVNSCNERQDSQKEDGKAAVINGCDDLTGVNEHDKKVRNQAAYVEKSPMSDRFCKNCKLYLPADAGKECGRCLLFKGPVYPSGYCSYWAPLT